MKRWANLSNSIVVDVVEQDSQPIVPGVWIECLDWVAPNDRYENGVFTKYVVPPPPPIVSKIAMITRFTDAEYVGILAAAKTDVEVQGWLDRFYASNTIDLSDSRTISGINMIVSKGLLTQARADEIVNTPAKPGELA